jgi:hypothetical protein
MESPATNGHACVALGRCPLREEGERGRRVLLVLVLVLVLAGTPRRGWTDGLVQTHTILLGTIDNRLY